MPVRWNFIKSPKARRPYTRLKRLYEIELRNLQGPELSKSDQEARALARENTIRLMKKRARSEVVERIAVALTMIIVAFLIVYFVVLKL